MSDRRTSDRRSAVGPDSDRHDSDSHDDAERGGGHGSDSHHSDCHYEGADNLELLARAVRYNRYLVEAVLRIHPAAGSLLDFGAGTGTLAAAWAARGLEVCCVEPDARLRAALVQRGLRALDRLQAVPDAAFATACAINVLEHIRDDAATLSELGRKLRPGGRLFLWVPAFPMLFSSMDRKVGHQRRYSRPGLRSAARGSGLDLVSLHYADSLGFLASLLYKYFGSATGDLSAPAVRFYDAVLFPVSRFLDRMGARHLLGKNLVAVLERRRV